MTCKKKMLFFALALSSAEGMENNSNYSQKEIEIRRQFQSGLNYMIGLNNTQKDQRKGIELWEHNSKFGHYASLACLGTHYFLEGKEPKKAFNFLQKAVQCNKGHLALYYLGMCYVDGLGVEKNLSKAIELLKIAANRHSHPAITRLSQYYKIGLGVPQSEQISKILRRRAKDLLNQQTEKLKNGYEIEDVL